MKLAAQDFLTQQNKSITLMGMSGLGKTTLSEILAHAGWYHYSADYRIGTAYLNDPIIAQLREEVENIPAVSDLLDSGTIKFQNNISIDNLKPLSTFIGKIGNPEQGGLSLEEFKKRQALYLQGEIAAMHDVPSFILKAKSQGHAHFVNDSTGSLCELGNESAYKTIAEHSVLIYIKATRADEEELIARAQAYPKPLYFGADFLEEKLAEYMRANGLDYVALVDPDDFASWVFPELFRSRLPKYDYLAKTYGYTISADEARQVKTADDLNNLIASAMKLQEAA